MKILVQDTVKTPRDWITIDSGEWAGLPKLPDPSVDRLQGDDGVTEQRGHIFDVIIQGVHFRSADHYHFKPLANGGVQAITWKDDPKSVSGGEKWAEIRTFLPLAPDMSLGGAINTVQSRIIYAKPVSFNRLRKRGPIQNTELRPWSEFIPPPENETRHGLWVSDNLADLHTTTQTNYGWRDWADHLPPSERDVNGRLLSQRLQGRWAKARGTKTFFLYDAALTNTIHTVEGSSGFEMNATDLASPAVHQSAWSGADVSVFTHLWTTNSGVPNVADWPNGVYRCQIDVSSENRLDSYGFLTQGSHAGHFAVVDSGLTADQETWTQDEAAFTGTGIKLATNTIDPASGAAGDRFECLLAALGDSNGYGHHLEVSCDDSDSFADGPWTAPSGWTGKIIGVTNPAKISGIAVANIAKVNNVA